MDQSLGLLPYASNTRTKRNLAALKDAGWGILVTPENPKPPEGFRFAVDNGAWGCCQRGEAFNGDAFRRLVDQHGEAGEFVVVPDIVAGGMDSLEFSAGWLDELAGRDNLLLAVQDGMTLQDVTAVLQMTPHLGIFLGGSTEWKLKTMWAWGQLAHDLDRYYHVGRVNTVRRIRLAAEAGAHSVDGTSATRFACTVPKLDAARRQPSLLSPGNSPAC